MKSFIKYGLLLLAYSSLRGITPYENQELPFPNSQAVEEKADLFVVRYDGTVPISIKRKLLLFSIPASFSLSCAALYTIFWLYSNEMIGSKLYQAGFYGTLALGIITFCLSLTAFLSFILHDFEITVTRQALVVPRYTGVNPFAFWHYFNVEKWVLPYEEMVGVEYYDDEIHPVQFAIQLKDEEGDFSVVFSIPQPFKFLFYKLFKAKKVLTEGSSELNNVETVPISLQEQKEDSDDDHQEQDQESLPKREKNASKAVQSAELNHATKAAK